MSEYVKFSKNLPNFTRVKCSWKLILLHVWEKTVENSDYTFTSVDVSRDFGCSREAASHLISRGVKFGTYTRMDTEGYRPFLYKITKHGMNKGSLLAESRAEEYKDDRR